MKITIEGYQGEGKSSIAKKIHAALANIRGTEKPIRLNHLIYEEILGDPAPSNQEGVIVIWVKKS